jgi:hypothetical protein
MQVLAPRKTSESKDHWKNLNQFLNLQHQPDVGQGLYNYADLISMTCISYNKK